MGENEGGGEYCSSYGAYEGKFFIDNVGTTPNVCKMMSQKN